MGQTGCTETSVTTYQCCVRSQKSKDLKYPAEEAWSLANMWTVTRPFSEPTLKKYNVDVVVTKGSKGTLAPAHSNRSLGFLKTDQTCTKTCMRACEHTHTAGQSPGSESESYRQTAGHSTSEQCLIKVPPVIELAVHRHQKKKKHAPQHTLT